MDILIHDEIGQWGVSARNVLSQLAAIDKEQIDVSIHSPGGDMFDGLAIYNALKAHPAKVVVTVEGLAASAASIIAMAADEIRMPSNAYLMIHNPWGYVVGDANDMGEAADLFDRWANTTAAIYAKRAGITIEEARALQDQTVWMDGVQAQEAGFADEVIDELPQIKAFARLPQCLATDCPVQFGEPAAADEPADEPPADEPQADEPAADEPAADDQVADEPTDDESADDQDDDQDDAPADDAVSVDPVAQAAEIVELCQIAGQSARAAAWIREGLTADDVRGQLAKMALESQAQAAITTAPDITEKLQEAAKTNMTVRSLMAKNNMEAAVQYINKKKEI